jgi:serine/threonine-protein kinase
VAISRQGDAVAYVAPHGQSTQLYIRRLDEQEVHALPGTDGAFHPFFSPDGRWVAFFSGTELRKVPVTGGTPVTLTRVQDPVGAEWLTRDSLFVADKEGVSLLWVPPDGGRPWQAAPKNSWGVNAATVLPGHQYAMGSTAWGFLATISLVTGRVFALTSHGLAPPDSVDPREIIRGASPRYLSSGHLVFLVPGDGVLAAMPFDPAQMRVLGPPMPLVNGVREEATYKAGQFDISEDGTLVYVPGHNAGLGVLAWASSSGHLDTLPFPRSSYFALSVAPDGGHAIVRRLSGSGDLQESTLLDLARNQESRPWRYSGRFEIDSWMDRAHILRCCRPDDVPEVYDLKTQTRRRLMAVRHRAWAVSPDGRWWFATYTDGSQYLGVLTSAGDSTDVPQTVGPGGWAAAFSPDSRWLAFSEFEGTPRIVVVHVPFDGRRFEIAADGGDEPRWFPDGRRIVYKHGTQFMVIDVTTRGDSLVTSLPRPWISGPFHRVPGWAYDVGPDGRLLVIVGPAETSAGHLNVVTGFGAMVRRVSQPGETPKR